MLSLRVRTVDSCWCAKREVARRVDRTQRTVQSSWARLKAAGWIEHHQVEAPDPDDPRNVTGWRFRFPRTDGRSASPQPISPPPGKGFLPPPKGEDRPLFDRPTGDVSFSEKPISPKGEQSGSKELTGRSNVVAPSGSEVPEKAASGPVAPSAHAGYRLLHWLRVRRHCEVRATRDGELVVKPDPSDPLSENDRSVIERHKAAILAELPAGRPPTPGAGAGRIDAPPRAAPKVPRPVQADLRDLAKRLTIEPDPSLADRFAAALVAAFGDADPTGSHAAYCGIACDVQSGLIGEGCLPIALAWAFGPKAENRGASFIAGVKSWLRVSGKRSASWPVDNGASP